MMFDFQMVGTRGNSSACTSKEMWCYFKNRNPPASVGIKFYSPLFEENWVTLTA